MILPSPALSFTVEPGSQIGRLTGKDVLTVNSLHGQGIRQLAPGLIVEARADDGLVEAYRVEAASAFALAVQWHPEWKVHEHPYYLALFEGFARACRERAGRC